MYAQSIDSRFTKSRQFLFWVYNHTHTHTFVSNLCIPLQNFNRIKILDEVSWDALS